MCKFIPNIHKIAYIFYCGLPGICRALIVAALKFLIFKLRVGLDEAEQFYRFGRGTGNEPVPAAKKISDELIVETRKLWKGRLR